METPSNLDQRMDRIDQRIERMVGLIEAHDEQIEALIVIAEQ